MAGRHRSDHVAIKVPDEPGSPTHSRHAGHALRGQSACPRPQYPTLRGNRTIKNEAKEKPRIGNIRFYPPATRRQANILHRTAKTCTSTPSANNFLPPRQDSAIAPDFMPEPQPSPLWPAGAVCRRGLNRAEVTGIVGALPQDRGAIGCATGLNTEEPVSITVDPCEAFARTPGGGQRAGYNDCDDGRLHPSHC